MKHRSTAFWLYTFLIGFLAVLGLAYAFYPTAFERLPWPWFLIFIPPVIMFLGRDGNRSQNKLRDKKAEDAGDDRQ